ncbi:uncharacterized protein Dana_GF14181 [Drosophila ananassae]|uniref:Uncharacterized protein n=1 Tax=Drosophila ananassae TaxID=7217 RepID=B3MNX1_DROAN|nr:uncharacterized protein LOC6497009 [Drosophila ananassae]EDV32158.1 uncharacterized protein Dana_GF14181 [Drosophila ananassae]
MATMLDTPILSIYDMMMDRQRALIRESQKKAMYRGAFGLRRLLEEKAAAASDAKKLPVKPKMIKSRLSLLKVSSPYCLTPKSETPLPPNTITAAHLTKKQLSIKVQQPGKREVISKLVERMSKGCPKTTNESPHLIKKSKSKQQISFRRKKNSAQGTSHGKKGSKSSANGGKRLPLSPRKAGGANKGHSNSSASPKPKSPKSATKKTRLQVLKSKLSPPLAKVIQTPPTGRWRI